LIYYDKMAAHLSIHGVRTTRQRLAIANALFKDEGRHVDATCLHVELRTSAIKVSLATVYNVLKAFDKAGLVRRVILGCERVLYDTDPSNHHHFFVVSEDRVIDIKASNADGTSPKIPDGYRVSRVETVIHLVQDDPRESTSYTGPTSKPESSREL
jgi:Fur family iron response transcriptional regulator